MSNATDIVRRSYEAFSSGDIEEFRRVWHPDIAHTVPGASPYSGTHRGIEAVLANMDATGESAGGTMSADLHDIVADNDGRAAAVITSRATRGGETVEETHVLLFTVADDEITEIRSLVPDLEAFTRFWS
jgi:ketosteroid isomerase-like protein